MCRHRSGWARCDQNVNWIGYKCAPLHADVRSYLSGSSIIQLLVACENIRFSSPSSPLETFRAEEEEDTKNWTNLYLEPHDYQIYYVNIDLRQQYGISAAESQTFLRAKRPKRCFRRLSYWLLAPRFFFLRVEPPRRGHHRGCTLTPSEHFAILPTKH